ncbi:MAG: type II secretion system F family protein [Planctomycetota bacterium]
MRDVGGVGNLRFLQHGRCGGSFLYRPGRIVKLSDRELIGLLEEIAGVTRQGRSWSDGLTVLRDQHVGRIRRATDAVLRNLSAGQPAEDAIADMTGARRPMVRAAMSASLQTGSAGPVADLARALRMDRERERRALRALVYPVTSLMLTYALFWLAIRFVLPRFMNTEPSADAALDQIRPALPLSVVNALQWVSEHPAGLPLLAVGACVVWWLWSRLRYGRFQMPLVASPGFESAWALFADCLAVHLQAGTLLDDAVAQSRAVAGLSATVKMPGLLDTTVHQLERPVDVHTAAKTLKTLSDWYDERAMRRESFWCEVFPSLVGVVGMSVICLVIGMGFMIPLYEAALEVASP